MFKKGDWIQAKLIEEVESNRWIVSFQGQLYSVKNSTQIPFKQQKILTLEVTELHPLQLKIVSTNAYKASTQNKKIGINRFA